MFFYSVVREQSLLMLGGGPEDIWGGHQKFINHLGGATKNIRER